MQMGHWDYLLAQPKSNHYRLEIVVNRGCPFRAGKVREKSDPLVSHRRESIHAKVNYIRRDAAQKVWDL